MGRRSGLRAVCAALAVLTLAVSLVCVLRPAAAAADDDIIIMVTGYRVNAPQRSTMPFFSGGLLYVPLSMFEMPGITATSFDGGIIISDLYTAHALYFDTASGTASNETGTVYASQPIMKNSLWFVPLLSTAEHLDLYASYYEISPAPFARLSRHNELVMSDKRFIAIYPGEATPLIEAYLGVTTGTSAPQTLPPTTATTATTATPATTATTATTAATTAASSGSTGGTTATQKPTTPVTTAPTEPPRNYLVYLVIGGFSGAEQTLDILRSHGAPAVFAAGADALLTHEATVRRIAVRGFGFALTGDVGRADAALRSITKLSSRLCCGLDAEGFRRVTPAVSLTDKNIAEAAAAALLPGGAVIYIPCENAPELLGTLAGALADGSVTYGLLTELNAN